MMKRCFVTGILCAGMLFFVPLVLSQTAISQAVYAAEYDKDTIAGVQDALNKAGYDCGTADGIAGDKTHEAIRQYQEEKGLNASGEIDDELLDSLGISTDSDRPTGEASDEENLDESEETEKGERGNPYEFGEDIPLGQVFDDDEWAEITICFDSVLKPRQVLSIDLADGLSRNFYAKAKVEVKDTSVGEDEKINFGIDANYYTSDMTKRNAEIDDSGEKSTLRYVYSDCDYDLNVKCNTDQSYDSNMKFVELIYQSEADSEEETSVWVKIPEYWNEEDAGNSEEEAGDTEQPDEGAEDAEAPEEAAESQDGEMVDGMRVSFKEAMDSYEEFFNEYCDFMEKYQSSDGNNLSMLADYLSFMSKYTDTMNKLESWESEDMNTAESAYYLEVSSRILNRLAQVTGY